MAEKFEGSQKVEVIVRAVGPRKPRRVASGGVGLPAEQPSVADSLPKESAEKGEKGLKFLAEVNKRLAAAGLKTVENSFGEQGEKSAWWHGGSVLYRINELLIKEGSQKDFEDTEKIVNPTAFRRLVGASHLGSDIEVRNAKDGRVIVRVLPQWKSGRDYFPGKEQYFEVNPNLSSAARNMLALVESHALGYHELDAVESLTDADWAVITAEAKKRAER